MTATLSLINGIVSDLRCEDAPTDCAGYVEGRLQGANCAELNLPYRRPAFACSRTGRQLSLDALGAASMRTTQSIVANRELLRWHNLLLDERAGGPEIDVFYTDVPFGEERNPDAARYLEFTNQLVHVANDFLSRNGGVVPVEKASEFIEFLQTEAPTLGVSEFSCQGFQQIGTLDVTRLSTLTVALGQHSLGRR